MAINLDHVTEQITVTDTAANASLTVNPKGTGAFNIAAGSGGLNLSNGGTVTALTLSGVGYGYTTQTSAAISAPTTANGVQATATVTMGINTASVASGGTGYAVGNVLSVVGGTSLIGAATLTVTAVSGGVITAVSSTNFAAYSALPSSPVSVTGGSGSGATFNPLWFTASFIITNAGSGYVEQPTVTFSGGGGSGAAAYATVGSNTSVKSLGTSLLFYTPAGVQGQFSDSGGSTPTAYPNLNGSSFGLAYLTATGSAANAGLVLASKGASAVGIYTNSTGSQAASFSHTASAVNYVQVTGAATGVRPLVLMQGSDANIGVNISSKGNGDVLFTGGSANFVLFRALGGASFVNYVQATSSATGVAVQLAAIGSDTNIPLVLQPKGTGALQAQQTDSTATGGNARGINAVDWQTFRGAANQVASGSYSVVSGGYGNKSTGYSSGVTGGLANNSIGGYSFSGGGLENSASSSYTVTVGGFRNNATGPYNFIGGGHANSGTSGSSVTTQSATMNGTTAVTLSASNAAIKVGQFIAGTYMSTYPADTYVAAISGTSLTLSQAASGSGTATLSFFTPHGVVVGGGNNTATGSYSFIGGGGDAGTAGNRNVASGDWSFVGGGRRNTASGIGSTVAGGGTDGGSIFSNIASGTLSTVSGGWNNVAGGTIATVSGGQTNNANGTAATITGGSDNVATGSYATVVGGQLGWTRSINGNVVFSPCAQPIAFGSGLSQTALLVLARQTTDATSTVLRSDTSAASTTNQVILPNNSAYFFTGEVVAGVTGGGNTKGWTIEGVIKRGANTASTALVGTPTVTSTYADAGASTWVIAVTADTTNGGLAVTFTGQLATTIRCVAQIRTTEMTF